MKIGIFGGSFNPPHKFHKEIVEYLLDNKYLDLVVIAPTGDNYQKRDLAPFINRLDMLNIMFKGNKKVVVTPVCNDGIDYTYQILDLYKKEYPKDDIYFIMGEDNLKDLPNWKKYDYLIKNYKFMLISRDNLNMKDEKYVERVKLSQNDISSTMIRDLIKDHKDVSKYLDKEVINYISNYNLYDYKTYKNEEEFLKHYDPSIYPRFAVAADILVFGISNEDKEEYRRTDNKKMSILLIKRSDYPYKDKWCLPGGFVYPQEDLEDAPKRVLKNETGLENIYLEQLYTFGSVNRDPRMRVVSSSYMALIDKDKVDGELKNKSSWFDIVKVEEKDNVIKVVLNNNDEEISFKVKRKLKDETSNIYDYEVVEDKYLSFDNPLIIINAIERIKNKILYTDIVFNMMPKLFTLGELQKVYEVILGKKLLDPAFRRVIKDKVEETDEYKTGEGHRPSKLFKYKK